MRQRFTLTAAYSLVFATGAAGLIYEVTWQKYLSRLLGSDTVAGAIILATFLGGLSIGYFLCGKMTLRVRNHFRLYAALEAAIGAWSLCFPTLFEAVRVATLHWSFAPPAAIIFQGVFACALLIALPTFCMGATVPVLTPALSKSLAEVGGVHARIYAVNTAGAFAGTLLAGFVLIPCFGLPLTVRGTAFINLAAGAFFAFAPAVPAGSETRTPVKDRIVDTPVSRGISRTGPPSAVLILVSMLSGFYVMTLENVLIRITNLSMGTSSYSFALVVAVFVLAIACGSFLFSRLKHVPEHTLFTNQFCITLSLLVLYATLDTWPYWSHLIRIAFESGDVDFLRYHAAVLCALTLVLIVPAGFMGATVPIVYHEVKKDLGSSGKFSGLILSWNTAGSLLGSLIGGIVLTYFLSNAGVFLAAALLAAVSTCLSSRGRSKKALFLAGSLTVLVAASVPFTPFYDPSRFSVGTFRLRDPLLSSFSGPAAFFREWDAPFDVKFYKDGPASTVAVVETPSQAWFDLNPLAVMVNGKSDSSTVSDMYTIKLAAHIPALLAPHRSSVMIVGLGTGVTAGELTLYPDVERIDVAEISGTVIEAFPFFDAFTHGVRNDPRLHIHTGDAFRILGRSTAKWDIVISEPSNPWVTGVDLLFTREFYKLVREHLTGGGVLLQWIHTFDASPAMVGTIVNTLRQEFASIRVFLSQANDLLILAGDGDVSVEDIARAETTFESNGALRDSLRPMEFGSLDCLLLREIWCPAYTDGRFADFGVQTMDYPRLHYMAARSYFRGDRVPASFLLSADTATYAKDYLLSKRHAADSFLPDSPKLLQTMLDSAADKTRDESCFLPMAKALKLGAFLRDPVRFPLSGDDAKDLRIDVVRKVEHLPADEMEWAGLGLEGASAKKKAKVLLRQVEQSRNWIVPYGEDGLKALLVEGMCKSRRTCERMWCASRLAALLAAEDGRGRVVRNAGVSGETSRWNRNPS